MADATSFHLVQKFTVAGFLELKSVQGTNNKSKVQNNEECSPKSLNPQEKHTAQISPKASNASNSTLPDLALIQGLKWVAIESSKLGEFNATKIIKNRGWKRRESTMKSYGEQ
ncbi:type I inositol 1,4,5-trisphosphate 5-phosphatase 2 [Dorcoceras hygrometricum]|uniref:Type I inositol 1,4,5-trisphosphate 5-phosphatase 2 n=1 Tax=Dorcoceras hygrometricum TaxID=472368 RepID=A0A2Z7BWB1_9LAMI|nr:type I inositol 1,4,5-trisphosphate 5-phosphatase 2 [Dorcoceras hygrometricum]